MNFIGILKSSKTRLSLRVYNPQGVGELVTFYARKSGISCIPYSSFTEDDSLSISDGLLSVTYFSDAWRVEFVSSDGSVCLLDLYF